MICTEEIAIVHDLPFDEYQNHPGVSQSFLWRMLKESPAAAVVWAKRETPPSAAMRFGSLVDCLLLEPDQFFARYQVGGPINPKTGKAYGVETKAWAEFEAALPPGQSIVSAEDFQRGQAVRDAILDVKEIRQILDGAVTQASMFWADQESGVKVRARPDIINERIGIMADLKVSEDPAEHAFAGKIAGFGYHFQAATYLDGWRQIRGGKPLPWLWIVAEPEEPYQVEIYELSKEDREQGMIQLSDALHMYRDCMASNVWPKRPTTIKPIRLPKYARTEITK